VESLRGKLLIASPTLLDPNFERTVVLIADHDEEGAIGVVLNRPSGTTVAETVPELVEVAGGEALVHVGGPVQEGALIVLAEFSDPAAAASIVVADVGLVSASAETADLPAAVRRARVYAGHAGWGPGQLEREVEEEAWIVEAPLPAELFPSDPETLWRDVLLRKGGRYALLARMPADPSLN
jgi:putative transcriptional regulator